MYWECESVPCTVLGIAKAANIKLSGGWKKEKKKKLAAGRIGEKKPHSIHFHIFLFTLSFFLFHFGFQAWGSGFLREDPHHSYGRRHGGSQQAGIHSGEYVRVLCVYLAVPKFRQMCQKCRRKKERMSVAGDRQLWSLSPGTLSAGLICNSDVDLKGERSPPSFSFYPATGCFV